MKKFLMLGIIIFLMAFMAGGYKAHATDVGGIISSDTVWTLSESPYTIINKIQIAEDVKLTINPGVIVKGVKGSIDFEIWCRYAD